MADNRHNFPIIDGGVAQGLEQWNHNPCVGGSIPPLATNNFPYISISYM